jgi:hypothetical protein
MAPTGCAVAAGSSDCEGAQLLDIMGARKYALSFNFSCKEKRFMAEAVLDIKYNELCAELEEVLAFVNRPGTFYCSGNKSIFMPKIDITGVGVLSFPLLTVQIQEMIALAERAPYGRGDQTLLDTSVRKVWQIPPSLISISSKTWKITFDEILNHVKTSLGCVDFPIEAELYKMLIYDEGTLRRFFGLITLWVKVRPATKSRP